MSLFLLILLILSSFVSGILFACGRSFVGHNVIFYTLSVLLLVLSLFLSVCLVDSIVMDIRA